LWHKEADRRDAAIRSLSEQSGTWTERVLYRLSWPLTPAARNAFLASVMQALQKQPTIGDGVI
jgi:hypothetical protein